MKPRPGLWQRLTRPVRRLLGFEATDPWGEWLTDIDIHGMKGLWGMMLAFAQQEARRTGGQQSTQYRDAHQRDVARVLERYNPLAQGIFAALRTYVLGDGGLKVEVTARPGQDAALALQAQVYLDDFRDREDWWSREREIFTRSIRDGECFLRFFESEEGPTVRPLEPEYIAAPDGTPEWTFGLHNVPGDVETIDALWLREVATAGEEVPAAEFYHMKRNVDRVLKRGLSDFASVADTVSESMVCLNNILTAESIRQAIVYITHYEHASPADLEAIIAGQTDYTTRTPAGKEMPVSVQNQVRERHLSAGQTLAAVPAPEAINGAIAGINAALLAASRRYQMPLWIISGDASANNAIDLGAETPFGKYVADEQAWLGRHERNVFWRVLLIGVDRGDLPLAVVDAVDVRVQGQTAARRDPFKETERLQRLYLAGILSKKSWAAAEGLDFQSEQDERAKEEPGPAPELPPLPGPAPADKAAANGASGRGGYFAN
jgi:hypothetical protein